MGEVFENLRKDIVNGSSDESKKQVATVGPMIRSRNILNSVNSSAEEIGEILSFHLKNDELKRIFLETLRSYELNDEYSKFKSYSLDPFPDCQMKKRIPDIYRKRNEDATEPVKTIDCNGGICTQSQRSDHIPLLVNTNRKRWHSLEMVRADTDHEISGCEDLIDNSKSH